MADRMTSPADAAAEERVAVFRERREDLMGKSDGELVVAADIYLMRRLIPTSLGRVIVKATGKVSAGIALKWAERSALANMIAQVDAEE